MKRFNIKMLVAITIGAFTTFTMLLYMSSESARCNSALGTLCFYVSKEDLMFKNINYNFEGSKNLANILLSKTGTKSLKRYYMFSKSRAFNFKFGSTISEFYKGPRRTVLTRFENASDFRESLSSPRTMLYGEEVTKVRFLTSATDLKPKPEASASLANLINSQPSLKSVIGSVKENDFNVTNKKTKDEYFYIKQNLPSLVKSDKFNISRANDASFSYYLERQNTLRQECLKYYNGSQMLKVDRLKLDHILIDESRKILFCYVPKVACTNWKRIFMLLTGKASNISQAISIPSYEVHARNLFMSLQNYSLSKVNQILQDYTKFIFVRNPFERLLSAYRNKLEQHYDSSKYFQARFGKFIVKKFRKNPSNVSLERGDDVTFSEFVEYLISSDARLYNEHWQTVTNLCHPCFINYDLIGKYETLIRDSNFVLKYLKLNFSFPVLEKPSRTASNLKKYYSTIKRSIIYKLYSIYEMDFKLFGYDLFKTLK